jgi:hypothetical protein
VLIDHGSREMQQLLPDADRPAGGDFLHQRVPWVLERRQAFGVRAGRMGIR